MSSEREKNKRATRPTCAFCGAEGGMTKQHILGQQFHSHILDPSPAHNYRQFGLSLGNGEAKYRPLPAMSRTNNRPLRTLTTRTVCGKCNGGWMSRVEDRAAPSIGKLVAARVAGVRVVLSEDECRKLARWAVLVSWCLELNATVDELGGTRTSTQALRSFMVSDQVPEHATVWIGRCDDQDTRYWQGFAGIGGIEGDDSYPASNLLTTVFTFGGLAFFVTTVEAPSVQPLPDAQYWCRIWPLPMEAAFLPVPVLTGYGLSAAMTSLSYMLREPNAPR